MTCHVEVIQCCPFCRSFMAQRMPQSQKFWCDADQAWLTPMSLWWTRDTQRQRPKDLRVVRRLPGPFPKEHATTLRASTSSSSLTHRPKANCLLCHCQELDFSIPATHRVVSDRMGSWRAEGGATRACRLQVLLAWGCCLWVFSNQFQLEGAFKEKDVEGSSPWRSNRSTCALWSFRACYDDMLWIVMNLSESVRSPSFRSSWLPGTSSEIVEVWCTLFCPASSLRKMQLAWILMPQWWASLGRYVLWNIVLQLQAIGCLLVAIPSLRLASPMVAFGRLKRVSTATRYRSTSLLVQWMAKCFEVQWLDKIWKNKDGFGLLPPRQQILWSSLTTQATLRDTASETSTVTLMRKMCGTFAWPFQTAFGGGLISSKQKFLVAWQVHPVGWVTTMTATTTTTIMTMITTTTSTTMTTNYQD